MLACVCNLHKEVDRICGLNPLVAPMWSVTSYHVVRAATARERLYCPRKGTKRNSLGGCFLL